MDETLNSTAQRSKRLLATLLETYPVFRAYLPLGTRVFKELCEKYSDRSALYDAYLNHISCLRYQKMLTQYEYRFNLQGQPCELIDAYEVLDAKAIIQKARHKELAKKKRIKAFRKAVLKARS